MNTEYPKVRDDIVVSKVGQETMLFDPKTERVHILNKTASWVWKMIDGRHGLKEIIQSLRRNFNVATDVPVESDITYILDKFKENGLLKD